MLRRIVFDCGLLRGDEEEVKGCYGCAVDGLCDGKVEVLRAACENAKIVSVSSQYVICYGTGECERRGEMV